MKLEILWKEDDDGVILIYDAESYSELPVDHDYTHIPIRDIVITHLIGQFGGDADVVYEYINFSSLDDYVENNTKGFHAIYIGRSDTTGYVVKWGPHKEVYSRSLSVVGNLIIDNIPNRDS